MARQQMACALITAAAAAANLSLPRADVCTARVRVFGAGGACCKYDAAR